MKKYIPLHVHSHYSLLDGLSRPKQIAQRCVDIGVKSCAITDHGNIAGAAQVHAALKSKGIKPILGCELYICDQHASMKDKSNGKLSHFIVLAKNLQGWNTLVKIISESNKPEHFYRKPRLSIDQLAEIVDENIIGFCGHLGSYLANKILSNDEIVDNWKSIATTEVKKLKKIFGDNFFLETQLMDKELNPAQISLAECIRELSKDLGVRAICTPDAHYANQKDAIDQRILLCNNLKTTLPEINRKLSNEEDVPMSTFFISDKKLEDMIQDVLTKGGDPPANKIRKIIFKDYSGLTANEKMSIVGKLIGRSSRVDGEAIYQCMLDLNDMGKTITWSRIAGLLNCSTRTIQRNLNDCLRKEKAILNEEI